MDVPQVEHKSSAEPASVSCRAQSLPTTHHRFGAFITLAAVSTTFSGLTNPPRALLYARVFWAQRLRRPGGAARLYTALPSFLGGDKTAAMACKLTAVRAGCSRPPTQLFAASRAPSSSSMVPVAPMQLASARSSSGSGRSAAAASRRWAAVVECKKRQGGSGQHRAQQAAAKQREQQVVGGSNGGAAAPSSSAPGANAAAAPPAASYALPPGSTLQNLDITKLQLELRGNEVVFTLKEPLPGDGTGASGEEGEDGGLPVRFDRYSICSAHCRLRRHADAPDPAPLPLLQLLTAPPRCLFCGPAAPGGRDGRCGQDLLHPHGAQLLAGEGLPLRLPTPPPPLLLWFWHKVRGCRRSRKRSALLHAATPLPSMLA